MMHSNNHFAQLAAQVRSGDARAQGQFQHELESQLARIVARALAPDAPPTPTHQRIRALSRQLNLNPNADPLERRRFTQVLCQRVVNRLTPRDTLTLGALDSRAG